MMNSIIIIYPIVIQKDMKMENVFDVQMDDPVEISMMYQLLQEEKRKCMLKSAFCINKNSLLQMG